MDENEEKPVENAEEQPEPVEDTPTIVHDHLPNRDRHVHEHDYHRYDTNGWGGHADMAMRAEKRFNKAAMAYCYHMHSGGHDKCIADRIDCPFFIGLIDAYVMVVTS